MQKIAIQISLIAALSLGISTAGGAHALPGTLKKSTTTAETVATPEIQSAEQRVQQAKAQVDVATKQLNAARALLTAARADLKAAETQLSALKLKQTAQGLVDETGMTPAKAAPVSLAAKPPVVTEESPRSETEATSAPVPAGDTRIRTGETHEPVTEPGPAPIPLR